MKVSELIEKLKEMPPHLDVIISLWGTDENGEEERSVGKVLAVEIEDTFSEPFVCIDNCTDDMVFLEEGKDIIKSVLSH